MQADEGDYYFLECTLSVLLGAARKDALLQPGTLSALAARLLPSFTDLVASSHGEQPRRHGHLIMASPAPSRCAKPQRSLHTSAGRMPCA